MGTARAAGAVTVRATVSTRAAGVAGCTADADATAAPAMCGALGAGCELRAGACFSLRAALTTSVASLPSRRWPYFPTRHTWSHNQELSTHIRSLSVLKTAKPALIPPDAFRIRYSMQTP